VRSPLPQSNPPSFKSFTLSREGHQSHCDGDYSTAIVEADSYLEAVRSFLGAACSPLSASRRRASAARLPPDAAGCFSRVVRCLVRAAHLALDDASCRVRIECSSASAIGNFPSVARCQTSVAHRSLSERVVLKSAVLYCLNSALGDSIDRCFLPRGGYAFLYAVHD
jgi:hypothetical protein